MINNTDIIKIQDFLQQACVYYATAAKFLLLRRGLSIPLPLIVISGASCHHKRIRLHYIQLSSSSAVWAVSHWDRSQRFLFEAAAVATPTQHICAQPSRCKCLSVHANRVTQVKAEQKLMPLMMDKTITWLSWCSEQEMEDVCEVL